MNKEEIKKKWKKDIKNFFIPACSSCGKKATRQTAKGKYAQKNGGRPCNWGYYCEECYKKGLEREKEAMYS